MTNYLKISIVRIAWHFIFGARRIFGMGEAKHFKFVTQIDLGEC